MCADVRRNDLPSATFDLAFARYLFLHLPDPAQAMRMIDRHWNGIGPWPTNRTIHTVGAAS